MTTTTIVPTPRGIVNPVPPQPAEQEPLFEPFRPLGEPHIRHTFCATCGDLVPETSAARFPTQDGKGSEPLCRRCALPVRCDGCESRVPLGYAHVFPDFSVLCPCCFGEEGDRE